MADCEPGFPAGIPDQMIAVADTGAFIPAFPSCGRGSLPGIVPSFARYRKHYLP